MIVFPDGQEFLTTGEVARAAGVTVQWIRYEIEAGKIRSTKVGRQNYIRPEDAEDWMRKTGRALTI